MAKRKARPNSDEVNAIIDAKKSEALADLRRDDEKDVGELFEAAGELMGAAVRGRAAADSGVADYAAQIQGHLAACGSSRDDVPHLLRALLASNLAILEKL